MKNLAWLAVITLLAGFSAPAHAAFVQEGNKLLGTGNLGASNEGYSVAVSADGNTALVGGYTDNSGAGATWVFTRSGGVWTQQGSKLIGTGATGPANQGFGLALSADGNTALVGGSMDSSYKGAFWVFTRTGGVWTQQGAKLRVPALLANSYLGVSVALSADGNTALIGAFGDAASEGSAYVFTRSGDVWSQQGGKLFGTGGVGARQGSAVSLSADGNTALLGGYSDNYDINTGTSVGATWVFTRTDGEWTQQGNKLIGTGAVGFAQQGSSVSLSADGNTALIGGNSDKSYVGATWVFTRSGGVWTQQGNKLVGTGNVGNSSQGISVSLAADGNTALIGGSGDNSNTGATWVFVRSGGAWTQQGNKFVGTGSVGAAQQGSSVSLGANGTVAMIGGPYDNGGVGAAWAYSARPAHHFSVTAPAAVTAGKGFSVAVTALDSTEAIVSTYTGTVKLTSTDGAAALPANYPFVDGGAHIFDVTLNSAGVKTITATDTTTSALTSTGPSITVNPAITVGPAALPSGTINQAGYSQTVSASGGTGALSLIQTGTLPPGLSFAAATGVISGTPTALGTFTLTVTATDTLGAQGSQTYNLTINKVVGAVALSNLTQTFDGTPKAATATTNPPGLTVFFTYDGSPTTPSAVGSYAVVATIFDTNFQGSATGTLNISYGSTTSIVSGPSASPNPTFVLQQIAFSVTAANSSNAPLTYNWIFGDGAQGAGASALHAYPAPGTYTATVTVTSTAAPVTASVQVKINTGVSVVGPGPDSDGDGFSDEFEKGAGTVPEDPASTPTGDPATDEIVDQLTVDKASIKLNFAKTGADTISFSGTVTIPAGFTAEGAKVQVGSGNVVKTITLNAKGSGTTGNDSVKISIKSKKGVVAAQTAKYTVNFKKGSFAAALAESGLTNVTVKGAPVVVPFTLIFNNSVLQTSLPMSYTAKAEKTGMAK